jgi:hypothetical protein
MKKLTLLSLSLLLLVSPAYAQYGGNDETVDGDLIVTGDLTVAGSVASSSTNPFLVPDGTEAAPGLAFTDDTDNGAFRLGADEWGLAVGGGRSFSLYNDGESPPTLTIWGAYTDASNYEKVTITTSGGFEFAAATAGTGGDNLGLSFSAVGSGAVTFNSTTGPMTSNIMLVRRGYSDGSMVASEGSPKDMFEVSLPQTADQNRWAAEILWFMAVRDATNTQVRSGRTAITAVNESGTVACTAVDVHSQDNTPTGTLTLAWTCAEDNADAVMFKAQFDSSIEPETSASLYWSIESPWVSFPIPVDQ